MTFQNAKKCDCSFECKRSSATAREKWSQNAATPQVGFGLSREIGRAKNSSKNNRSEAPPGIPWSATAARCCPSSPRRTAACGPRGRAGRCCSGTAGRTSCGRSWQPCPPASTACPAPVWPPPVSLCPPLRRWMRVCPPGFKLVCNILKKNLFFSLVFLRIFRYLFFSGLFIFFGSQRPGVCHLCLLPDGLFFAIFLPFFF